MWEGYYVPILTLTWLHPDSYPLSGCAQYAGGYSGIIMAGEHDLSHLNFCKEKATLVSLIHFGGHQENQSEEDMVPIITISWIFFTMLFILIELIRRHTK